MLAALEHRSVAALANQAQQRGQQKLIPEVPVPQYSSRVSSVSVLFNGELLARGRIGPHNWGVAAVSLALLASDTQICFCVRRSPLMSLSKTLPKTMLAVGTDEAAERRDSIRYQVTVAAEVIELISGTRFSTRTTDLGPGGCFVDTLMPLPVGSSVRVRLHKDNMAIEALGTVTYSQSGLGMGVAFDNMPPERVRALDAWLAELTAAKPHSFDVSQTSNHAPAKQGQPTDTAQKLVRLLVKRGVISEADAAALLTDAFL